MSKYDFFNLAEKHKPQIFEDEDFKKIYLEYALYKLYDLLIFSLENNNYFATSLILSDQRLFVEYTTLTNICQLCLNYKNEKEEKQKNELLFKIIQHPRLSSDDRNYILRQIVQSKNHKLINRIIFNNKIFNNILFDLKKSGLDDIMGDVFCRDDNKILDKFLKLNLFSKIYSNEKIFYCAVKYNSSNIVKKYLNKIDNEELVLDSLIRSCKLGHGLTISSILSKKREYSIDIIRKCLDYSLEYDIEDVFLVLCESNNFDVYIDNNYYIVKHIFNLKVDYKIDKIFKLITLNDNVSIEVLTHLFKKNLLTESFFKMKKLKITDELITYMLEHCPKKYFEFLKNNKPDYTIPDNVMFKSIHLFMNSNKDIINFIVKNNMINFKNVSNLVIPHILDDLYSIIHILKRKDSDINSKRIEQIETLIYLNKNHHIYPELLKALRSKKISYILQ